VSLLGTQSRESGIATEPGYRIKRPVGNSASDFSEPLQQIDRTYVLFRGRKLVYFGGCDYFRLSRHPEIDRALREGLQRYGLNPAASRFTTGNHPVYEKLEVALKKFFAVESATLTSSGYATNLAVAQALSGEFTHALFDEKAHASLRDAIAYLNCPARSFPHSNPAELKRVIGRLPRNKKILLLTDGLFAHSGKLAPLREYLDLLPGGSLLLVDDAHGAGTMGKHGRGSCEVLGIDVAQVVQTISFSKAFGVYGGAILGPREIRSKIIRKSGLARGNTPLPLPLGHAMLLALSLLRRDGSLRRRLLANIERLHSQLNGEAAPPAASPIIPIACSGLRETKKLWNRLLAAGIHAPLIAYGSQPSYFRFALSSEHEPRQIDALAAVLAKD